MFFYEIISISKYSLSHNCNLQNRKQFYIISVIKIVTMALFFQQVYDRFEMINTEKKKEKNIIMILTVCYSNDFILVQVHVAVQLRTV